MRDAFAAALAFISATTAACADEVVALPFGRVLRTPSLPGIWVLNAVEVAPDATPPDDDVLAAVAAHLAHAPWPSVVAAGARAPVAGWPAEADAVLVLDGGGPDAPPPGAVREGTAEEVAALMRRWVAESVDASLPEPDAGAMEQLLGYLDREWRARPVRAFVSPDATATCRLWSDGEVAQVEDVYTAPESRGHGLGRTLVAHAAALARAEGHALVFVVTEPEGRARALYEGLGFAEAGITTRSIRG